MAMGGPGSCTWLAARTGTGGGLVVAADATNVIPAYVLIEKRRERDEQRAREGSILEANAEAS